MRPEQGAEAQRQKVLGRIEHHKEELEQDTGLLSSIEQELVDVRILENEKPSSSPAERGE